MFDESSRHESSPEKDPAVEYPVWQHTNTAEAKAQNGVQLEYYPFPRDMVLAEWEVRREDGVLDLTQESTPPDQLACKWLSQEAADTTRGENLWHQLGGPQTGDPQPAGATTEPAVFATNDSSFLSKFTFPENQAWIYSESRILGLGADYLLRLAIGG